MKTHVTLPLLLLATLSTGCMIPYAVEVPSIRGCVLDAKEQTPVAEVSVALAGLPETERVTGKNGRFKTPATQHWRIFSFPLGDRVEQYELHLAAPLYRSATKSIWVFRQESVDVGDIKLEKRNHTVEGARP